MKTLRITLGVSVIKLFFGHSSYAKILYSSFLSNDGTASKEPRSWSEIPGGNSSRIQMADNPSLQLMKHAFFPETILIFPLRLLVDSFETGLLIDGGRCDN